MTVNTKLEFDGSAPNNARLQQVIDELASSIAAVAGAAQLPGVVSCINAVPGAYTVANSGFIFKDQTGNEIFRVWATQPDDTAFGGTNLYVGSLAGAAQPPDNVSAGAANTGIGFEAMQAITTGGNNAGIGYEALQALTTGDANTGVGSSALKSTTTGAANTGVGGSTLVDNKTGSNNVAIGNLAGFNGGTETTFSRAIIIGHQITPQSDSTDGQMTIGNLIFGSGLGASDKDIATLGKVSIGLWPPAARLHLPAGAAAANMAPLKITTGTLLTTPEDGAIEYDGVHLYITIGASRKTVTVT